MGATRFEFQFQLHPLILAERAEIFGHVMNFDQTSAALLHLRLRWQRLIKVLLLSPFTDRFDETDPFGFRELRAEPMSAIRTCLRAGSLAPFRSTMSGRPSFPVSSVPNTPVAVSQASADRELMAQVVAGDEAAFSSLYRQLSPGLFSMIYQILQDQKESEDVLQEAFVQMWKKASTYESERSALFTWAVMISRNKAIDRLRGRQRRTRLVEDAASELSVSASHFESGADSLSSQSEERRRIRGALSALPAAQREAIELAFFTDMTQAEVSAKLSEPARHHQGAHPRVACSRCATFSNLRHD